MTEENREIVDTVEGEVVEPGQGDGGLGEVTTKQRPRIPQKHGGSLLAPVRNREEARALAEKRWGRYRKYAEAGMVLGVLGPDTPITEAARAESYMTMVAVQAKKANDAGDPSSTQAARFVRQSIGADVGAPTKQNEGAAGVHMAMTLNSDAVRVLAEILSGVFG